MAIRKRKLVPPKPAAPASGLSSLKALAKPKPVAATGKKPLKAPSAPPAATKAFKVAKNNANKPLNPLTLKPITDGHYLLKMADPIKVSKLEPGMKIVYDGYYCVVSRVEPVKLKGLTHLMTVSINEHPTKGGITAVFNRLNDTVCRKIVSFERQG